MIHKETCGVHKQTFACLFPSDRNIEQMRKAEYWQMLKRKIKSVPIDF